MKHFRKIVVFVGALILPFVAAKYSNNINKVDADTTPVTFQRIEYLESNARAYFKTPYHISSDDFRIEIVASCNDNTSTSNILFSLNKQTNTSFWVGSNSGVWAVGTQATEKTNISSNVKALITYTRSKGVAHVKINNSNDDNNNAESGKFEGSIDSYKDNCYLFEGGDGKYLFNGKIYSCKYYQGDSLVSNLVPVKSSNGVYGLYDLVTNDGTLIANEKNDGTVNGSDIIYGSVNEQRYKKVEYINSTVGGKQCLDTGVSLSDESDHEYTFEIKAKCNDETIDASNVLVAFNGSAHTGQWAGSRNSVWILDPSKSFTEISSVDSISELVVTRKNGTTTLFVGGTEIKQTGNLNEGTTYLFGEKVLVHPFIGNLYSCKIFDNSKLIREYVPTLDTHTGVYGLFDLVEGEFNPGRYGFFGGNIVDNIKASLNFSYVVDNDIFTFNNGINLTTQWSIPETIYNNENYAIKLGYEINDSSEAFVTINKDNGEITDDNYIFQFSFKKIPFEDRNALVKVTIYVFDDTRVLYTLKLNDGNGRSVKSMANRYLELYDEGKGDTSYVEHINVLTYLAA